MASYADDLEARLVAWRWRERNEAIQRLLDAVGEQLQGEKRPEAEIQAEVQAMFEQAAKDDPRLKLAPPSSSETFQEFFERHKAEGLAL